MRKTWLLIAALTAGTPALAQSPRDVGPGPGISVDAVRLHTGETKAFTLAAGKTHQLLYATDPAHPAPKAIVVMYQMSGPNAVVTVTSRTGYPTSATVMADRSGDGGFTDVGRINTAGDGSTTVQSYPGALGTITIGSFDGGPKGD